ncbi:MAG: hypothetical protein ACI4PV_08320 [Butyricicoccus sp.]
MRLCQMVPARGECVLAWGMYFSGGTQREAAAKQPTVRLCQMVPARGECVLAWGMYFSGDTLREAAAKQPTGLFCPRTGCT